MLNSLFKLDESQTTVRTELFAGLTTFLTMAYIIIVNPNFLSHAGMDKDAVFVATCLAAAFGTLVMGFYANLPIALAPGMGLNAFFAYVVVKGMGVSWEIALAAVFISGILFLILSVLPVREWIVNSIPKSQKLAIAAGIGLFLGFIGLKSAGLVVDHPRHTCNSGKSRILKCLVSCPWFYCHSRSRLQKSSRCHHHRHTTSVNHWDDDRLSKATNRICKHATGPLTNLPCARYHWLFQARRRYNAGVVV